MFDLSRWRELRRITTATNCYLVWDEISREGALFDTGSDPAEVLKIIEAEGVQLRHLFLTHEQPVEAFRVPKLHTNTKNALPQHRNRANDFIHLGSLRITNRTLTDDKVIYIVGNWPEDAPHVAIIGEIQGVPEEIVREKILSLPGETLLCPLRGPLTDVAARQGSGRAP